MPWGPNGGQQTKKIMRMLLALNAINQSIFNALGINWGPTDKKIMRINQFLKALGINWGPTDKKIMRMLLALNAINQSIFNALGTNWSSYR